ncbi:MAG: TlyA family RNA methyltransferase [Clostridia bacterium]
MSKERLDVALVRRGLMESREKAQAHIMAGVVFRNNQRVDKASLQVLEEDVLEIRQTVRPFVSRGGHKLEKALACFHADVTDCVAMDIGAATGGFTDVLLQAGAKQVYAIDVGYGQLDWRLRNDPRVVVMERTNARYLTPESLPVRPTLCVMDVSFISIRLILPTAAMLMGTTGRFFSLVKPQFEAGRDKVGKKGVVRDMQVHREVLQEICAAVHEMDWRVQGVDFSPIKGPEGNIEFLIDVVYREVARQEVEQDQIAQIVAEAHRCLDRGPGTVALNE